MSFRRLAAVFAALAATVPSMAWHATGHMIVADIAWRNLNDKAKAEAARLVAIDAPEKSPDFITAAVWADDTKTHDNGPWHYIDLYFRADGQPTDLKPDEENAVWAIDKFSKMLLDKAATDADKGQALRYLLHFVGDMHQPLHCVSRVTDTNPKGDAGGNKFYVDDGSAARRKNLHSLWDSGCGAFAEIKRPLTDAGKSKIDAYADECLATLSDADKTAAHDGADPNKWATDGQALAKNVVYSTPENQTPSDEYLEKGKAACRKQVAIAGLRLADLLNKLLGA